MSNGEHSERIAAAEARDQAMDQRLGRIEHKLDRLIDRHADLRVRVAGWSAGIALLTSGIIAAGAQLLRAAL